MDIRHPSRTTGLRATTLRARWSAAALLAGLACLAAAPAIADAPVQTRGAAATTAYRPASPGPAYGLQTRQARPDAVVSGAPTPDAAMPTQAMPDPAMAGPVVEPPLAPGEFEWQPERSLAGEVVMVVSLPQQLVHVYRGGVRIGRSTISSGRSGHETPTGVFTILQKEREHRSNLYNDASMPYMQRLTWDGIALHAGHLPGRPASHGCIRLPLEFSKALYGATERGGIVVVADDAGFSADLVAPGDRAPASLWTLVEQEREQERRSDDAQQQLAERDTTVPVLATSHGASM